MLVFGLSTKLPLVLAHKYLLYLSCLKSSMVCCQDENLISCLSIVIRPLDICLLVAPQPPSLWFQSHTVYVPPILDIVSFSSKHSICIFQNSLVFFSLLIVFSPWRHKKKITSSEKTSRLLQPEAHSALLCSGSHCSFIYLSPQHSLHITLVGTICSYATSPSLDYKEWRQIYEGRNRVLFILG